MKYILLKNNIICIIILFYSIFYNNLIFANIHNQQHIEINNSYQITHDDIYIGNKNANIILIEYFSFTCPACVKYHKNTFYKIKTKYIDTNKIAYVFKEITTSKIDFDASRITRYINQYSNKKAYQFLDIILSTQDTWINKANYLEYFTQIAQQQKNDLYKIRDYQYNILEKLLRKHNMTFLQNPELIAIPSLVINNIIINYLDFFTIDSILSKIFTNTYYTNTY